MIVIFLFFLGLASVQAFALGGRPTPKDQALKQSSKAAEIKAKLTEGKLRACQARENALKNRTSALTKLATNMLDKFDAISVRVESYYTTKLVPANKTVANYNSLIADVASKKSAVSAILTSPQNDVAGFSCSGSDPKGQLTQFREDMQKVKSALKDYRTSIKNLIVSVRTANGESGEKVGTESAK